jgi:hypothetical protein
MVGPLPVVGGLSILAGRPQCTHSELRRQESPRQFSYCREGSAFGPLADHLRGHAKDLVDVEARLFRRKVMIALTASGSVRAKVPMCMSASTMQ